TFHMSHLSSVLFVMSGLCAQTAPVATPLNWTLPHIALHETGPRTYQFTVDYDTASPTGQIVQRQRVSGEYTRGLPNSEAAWHHVTIATAAGGLNAPFAPADQR